jgi:hypothetical protein
MERTAAAVVAGWCLVAASSVSAQTWGRPHEPSSGACFYEHANFEGRYFCTRAGEAASEVPADANDRISSIRVFGNARVVVYRDDRFRGKSSTFDQDMRDLRKAGWNDRISSYRIDSEGRGSGGWGGGDWGRPSVPSTGVCFYKDPGFRGDYFCAGMGASAAQVPSGTNDKISSIRVYGNAEVTVFQDAFYEGRSQRFDRSMSDLRGAGWNDLISSYRVRSRSSGSGSRDSGSRDSGSRGGGGNWGQSSGSRMSRQEAEGIVQRAYQSVLGRDPDPGSKSWVDEVMKHNWNQRQLEAELRKSPEYRAKQQH